MPKESRLATLVIRKAHLDTLRVRPKRVECSRLTAMAVTSLTHDLPIECIDIPTIAFENVGLDFAGSFSCKPRGKARSQDKETKASFDCSVRKAIHVECASEWTILGCVATIRHFISRGPCSTLLVQPTRSSSCNRWYLRNITTRSKTKLALSAIDGTSYPPKPPFSGDVWKAG